MPGHLAPGAKAQAWRVKGRPSSPPDSLWSRLYEAAIQVTREAPWELKAHPWLPDMWGQVPGRVVQKLADLGAVPAEVRVSSPLLFRILQPVTDQLGLRTTQADYLPAQEAAREELLQVI